MTEYWKDINDYEGLYQVSNLGNVRSTKTGRVLKPAKNYKGGYLQVVLYKNGRVKHFLVHRLVAEAFIPNPNNLPCINHKDEDKTMNIVENLEWCTHKYNDNYGTAIKRMTKTKSKTVLQLRMDGSLVRIWQSARKVQRQLHFNQSYISECCRGKHYSAYGYKWCYAK